MQFTKLLFCSFGVYSKITLSTNNFFVLRPSRLSDSLDEQIYDSDTATTVFCLHHSPPSDGLGNGEKPLTRFDNIIELSVLSQS